MPEEGIEMELNPKSNEKIGIVGLGYVGLPLAILFVSKGYHVIGIDIDSLKLNALQAGRSYLTDLSDEAVADLMDTGRFETTSDFQRVAEVTTVILCVPTPLRDHTNPDLSFVQSAATAIAPFIYKQQLIVLESSTFPGTTEEVLLPILEKKGKKVGIDFYLGYSPERIDPGNKQYTLGRIPKVVSGVTADCLNKITMVYEKVFDKLVPVSNPKTAEMTKLIENSQRFINISFMNEMAVICNQMGINVWEVIDAATTKPYGFTPYYPGPGIGGHCIPVDPLYLQWKANQFQTDSKFILLAKSINDAMQNYISSRIDKLVSSTEANVDRKILFVGVTYKKDVNDLRESTALGIISEVMKKGAHISYHDPYIHSVEIEGATYTSVDVTPDLLRAQDVVVILVDHSNLSYEDIVNHSSLIFDTRNCLPNAKNVVKL